MNGGFNQLKERKSMICFAIINKQKYYFKNNKLVLDTIEIFYKNNIFKCLRGECSNIVFGIEWEYENWNKENYVVFPGAVYNGNRFKSKKMDYPPMFHLEEANKNIETIITDIPRLLLDSDFKIELSTADMSTPSIGIKFQENQGLWITTEQCTSFGDSGINFIETNNKGIIQITAPKYRQSIYRWPFMTDECDCGGRIKEGESIEIKICMNTFECDTIPKLFKKFLEVRCDFGNKQQPEILPLSVAYKIQEEKFNEKNYLPQRGYYGIAGHGDDYDNWQIGWIGGAMVTLPLYLLGNEVTKERVLNNVEWICKTQLESGFFKPCLGKKDGKDIWFSDGYFTKGTETWTLIRKQADSLYFLTLLQEIIESPELKCSLSLLADRFVDIWKQNGQMGQFVDMHTGEIIIGNSTSGGIIPAALGAFSKYTKNKKYLEVAEEIGEYYYKNFIEKGFTTGGPGEILQCPDSESLAGCLESYILLFEQTNNDKWLEYAKDAANQLASWTVSYDYQWQRNCEFKRLDIKTTGSVIANAQNKHSAPGICTLSALSILKLYKYTKNYRYLELSSEISRFMSQCLSTDDRPIFSKDVQKLPQGVMCERVNMSDWEGEEWVGEVFNGSCWCEVSNMLTYLQIPSIFVDLNNKMAISFDHLKVEFDEDSLEIINNTNYNCIVKICIDFEHEKTIEIKKNGRMKILK